jgi:hypothetical protein
MHALEELNWKKIGLIVIEQSSVLSNGMPGIFWRPLEMTDYMRRYFLQGEVVC